MNRYTIYCTIEQTRKALELGAPIFHMSKNITCNGEGWVQFDGLSYTCPTAEQMLGWLEDQGILIGINYGYTKWDKWDFDLDGEDYIEVIRKDYNSRKEATIAAIDAAINYLLTHKQQAK